MERFLDKHGAKVSLSFQRDSFEMKPKHVFVICRYNNDWLLTNHKERGLEFPGGKKEAGETVEEAAHREVYEETGAILSTLDYIGEYQVESDENPFVKAIFYGKVEKMTEPESYFETNGPVLVGEDLLESRFGKEYSFIMKDKVVQRSLEYILNKKQEQKGQTPQCNI